MLPIFNVSHHLGTNTINVGGSEIIYIDMYIPPATSYKYHVHVHAPYNETDYGKFNSTHLKPGFH